MNFKKRVNGSWVDTPNYIHNTSTDTFTTLPADIYADGNNATVDISGNTVQNGIPTPDNPIMPQGTGERTGNLLDKTGFTNVGATIEQIEDGIRIITQSGGYAACIVLDVLQNTDYTVSYIYKKISGSGANVVKVFVGTDSSTEIATFANKTGGTFNSGNNTKINIWFYAAFGMAATVEYTKIMLNTGNTALPYEPYGYKIQISSANTTTPVYLGEVQTTRKIKKLVLTGEETFGYANSCFTYTFDGKPTSVQPIKEVIFSNIYEGVEPRYRDELGNYQCCITRNYNQIAIRDNNYADAADFKAYLAQQYSAGTPVCVWYVLAEPTTGIVNEPLRKIGDYADTVSGITIPTIAGKDTFDIQTTLKPSSVSLNYTGWHDAEAKEWDGSDWS